MEKKLYKSNQNKMLDGVCGGIAEYFGIDPTVVRLIWALFSLMGGCGILAYIIAAVIMVLMQRVLTGMPYTPIGLVIAPLATVLRWALEMMSWGVFIWVVMTWLNPQSPMTYALGTLVDPFVRPVRKIIPMFGRFDLSPIVVIILANVLLMLVTPISHGFIPL